jgi:hypothetical protein
LAIILRRSTARLDTAADHTARDLDTTAIDFPGWPPIFPRTRRSSNVDVCRIRTAQARQLTETLGCDHIATLHAKG